jgi:hypothetical protein
MIIHVIERPVPYDYHHKTLQGVFYPFSRFTCGNTGHPPKCWKFLADYDLENLIQSFISGLISISIWLLLLHHSFDFNVVESFLC